MAKTQKTSIGRRGFLKNAAGGAAALVTTTPLVEAQQSNGTAAAPAGGVPAPTQAQLAREAGNVRPPVAVRKITRPGSDLMVQTIRDLGIEFVAANPGSSFEGLQESFINYGNPPNQMPEFITALHEESAVSMAHVSPRPKVCRCLCCCTARLEFSTGPWPFTRPTMTACRS